MSWGSTFCLITGASRGIGQAIAVELSRKFGDGSVLLLLARTQSGLDETKKLVKEVAPNVTVHPVAADLQKAGTLEYKKIIEESLKDVNKTGSSFNRAILIHNAAGFQKTPTLKLDDVQVLRDDLALNFVSPILLNTQFFKVFDKNVPNRVVVQVSSGASKLPVPSGSMYASIKAARNHFFTTMAVEEPTIRVLSYDPGVVDTELFRKSIADDGGALEAVRKNFAAMGIKIIQPVDTAKVLLEYLVGDVKSGSFVNVQKNPDLYAQFMAKGLDAKKIFEKQ